MVEFLNYFEETGGAHWNGECFVFDRRVGVDGELNETTSEVCWACREPFISEQAASPEFYVSILSLLHKCLISNAHSYTHRDFVCLCPRSLNSLFLLVSLEKRFAIMAMPQSLGCSTAWSDHLDLIGVCP